MQKESVKKLQNELENGEALLVASVPNRFYLTGFETSDGFVFITREKACFLIDFRYVEKAKATVKSCEVRLSTYSLKEINELCRECGVSVLYTEAEHTSVSFNKQLCEALSPVLISDSDRFDKIIKDMRAVKNGKELSLIKAAQKLTDDTFNYIISRITEGRTEREVMLDMEFYMRKLGSEGVSFDFIVVSGKNSSLPAGGESTHAVLSAHCGLPSARLFTDLHLLKEGSLFRIHVLDEKLTYQVYDIETVNPDDSSSLFIQEGEDLVTLITCTPYGKNTHRLLVHGRRIEENEDTLIEEPKIEKKMTWEDYTKIAAICITTVFVLLLLVGTVKGLIRRKNKNEKAD